MKSLTFFLLCLPLVLPAQRSGKSSVLHVVTHDGVTVVTDPGKGNNPYPEWGVFPNRNVPVRKIVLQVTFACPDTMRCADWDYLDRIYIKRTGGKKGEVKNFEIAKMLTPYGGAFDKNWQFGWTVDVTDFSLLLRDSVEIEYNHFGYEPNHDRGWSVTLDFQITTGTPVAEPVSITKIYQSDFIYGDSLHPIEDKLMPVEFATAANADFAVLRVSQTGHGMDEGTGCGEFCSQFREVYFDGDLIDKRDIWKKCGRNPLYPQAGTWIFDRANWCPGYLLIPDRYLIDISPGHTHSVNIDMEPYVAKNPTAVESIGAYVIQYKKPSAIHDASIEEIIVPSEKGVHLRRNPACANPVVIVRNNGAKPLREFVLTYGTGAETRVHRWKGNLPFNEQREIELPGRIAGPGIKAGTFSVKLERPNGKRDEFPSDNSATSSFVAPPQYPQALIVYFQTNTQPTQNVWFIRDTGGKVVFEQKPDSLAKYRVFRDTIQLDPGCYEFVVQDSAGDGLEFWYNVRGGRGVARLLDTNGRMLADFESDFGSEIYHSFTVGADTSVRDTRDAGPSIGLFPTRTRGKTTLDYFANDAQAVIVQIITDDGAELVEEHKYVGLKEGVFNYDLSYRKPQRYYLKVFVNGALEFNKRVRVVD